MKCPYCDFENKETSKFCENCGAQLIEPEQTENTTITENVNDNTSTHNAHDDNGGFKEDINGGATNNNSYQGNNHYQGNNMYQQRPRKKNSKIGIAVLILGFFGMASKLFGFIAIGLGTYDLVKNKNKKHVLTIIGLVLACLGLLFSGNSRNRSTANNSKPKTTVQSTTESKVTDNSSVEVKQEEKAEPTEEPEPTKEPEPTEEPEPEIIPNTFIPGEIFNDYGVSITAEKIEYGEKETTFSFVMENTSDMEYDMAAHAYSVNGIMAGGSQFGSDLPLSSNSKARLTCSVDNEWLDLIGATAIDRFDIVFWAYGESMKEWGTGVISVPIEVTQESASLSPELVYEDDYISVSVLDVNTKSITYYVQNHSGYYVALEATDCSVDGWAYDLGSSKYDLYDELIFNNCSDILTLNIDSSFLEESGIDSPTSVNIKFDFRESEPESIMNMWKYTTDVITVNLS